MSRVFARDIPAHIKKVITHGEVGIIKAGALLAKDIRRQVPIGPRCAAAVLDLGRAGHSQADSIALQQPDEAINTGRILDNLIATKAYGIIGEDGGRV